MGGSRRVEERVKAIRINGYSELETDKVCYYKNDGIWYLYHPSCGLGNLKDHEVVEHEDGTITVSPSILITDRKTIVHGYFNKGVWTDC